VARRSLAWRRAVGYPAAAFHFPSFPFIFLHFPSSPFISLQHMPARPPCSSPCPKTSTCPFFLQVQGQGQADRQDGAGLDGSAYFGSLSLLACQLSYTLPQAQGQGQAGRKTSARGFERPCILFTVHFRIYLCVGRRRKGKDKPVVKKALVDSDCPVNSSRLVHIFIVALAAGERGRTSRSSKRRSWIWTALCSTNSRGAAPPGP